MKTKEKPINQDPQELQVANEFCTAESSFWILVIAYDRVGEGCKFSFEILGLTRRRFHTTSHLKIGAK